MKEEQVMHPKMLYTLREVAQIIGSNEAYV